MKKKLFISAGVIAGLAGIFALIFGIASAHSEKLPTVRHVGQEA